MTTGHTIAAFATPMLPGGRIVLRMSGPTAHDLTSRICANFNAVAGAARQSMLDFHGYRFPAWLYCFVGPHSYTGEDSVEFHLPGNPLLAQELLATLLEHGATLAEPGEFTARAFFNGKLDLTEAEGVAAVIAAADVASARSARQLLAGELARRLRPAMDRLSHTLALVEAEIDFSEEDVSFLPVEAIRSAIDQTRSELSILLDNANRLRPLSHETTIAIVGRPNAGKSTLVNALAGIERSVVSDDAGTTRDVLAATIKLPRGAVTLLDVAGLEPVSTNRSAVEQEVSIAMQQRAAHAVAIADRVVLVIAADDERPPVTLGVTPDLIVLTKAELGGRSNGTRRVSAHAGIGLDELRQTLDELAFAVASGDALMLNQRHEKSIRDAVTALDRAHAELGSNRPEFTAAELRHAVDELGGTLGTVTPDDILGKIFATFCIGK